MNREEARVAYLSGKKLKHRLFSEDVYIFYNKDIPEKKNSIPYQLFWVSPDYADGWDLYDE